MNRFVTVICSLVLCATAPMLMAPTSVSPLSPRLKGGTPIVVSKPSDTGIASSTSFADDPHLALTLPVNGADYMLLSYFVMQTSATPDFKYRLGCTACALSTMQCTYNQQQSTGTVGVAALTHVVGSGISGLIDASSTNNFFVTCQGRVRTNAANAVIALQWAQNTSDATGTTVIQGSWMSAARVR